MPKPTEGQLQAAFDAYERYWISRQAFADAMQAVGVQGRNFEPFANFAEVIAARVYGGRLQRVVNKGFELETDDGLRIQVKSLRVSHSNPTANNLDWLACTRVLKSGALIEAERLVGVVYLNLRPYAIVDFPIEDSERFPVVNVKQLLFPHVEKLLSKGYRTEGTSVKAIDLRPMFPRELEEMQPIPTTEER